MEEDDKGCPMIRMGVSEWVFLLVPAYPGCPWQKAVKRFCVCVCVCVFYLFLIIYNTVQYVAGPAVGWVSLLATQYDQT